MMKCYYKITKEQADLIGDINYDKDKSFNPFVGEQKDGSYLISDEMYLIIKDRKELKGLDLTKQPALTREDIDLKPFVKPTT